MGCNKYKNKNYKSALQYYNNLNQDVTVTDTVVSPIIIDLGVVTTDTGCAFDFNGRSYDVDYSGLYRFNNTVILLGVAAGDVTVAMTIDGIVVPETTQNITMVAGISKEVTIDLVKQLKTCCNISNHSIGVIVYSDGTGTATVTRISGNAVKLA